MLKIEKKKKSDWLLVDADFRGLQMALAFADCGLNEKGIDKIGYEIYGKEGHCDPHSTTGFSTFEEPIHTKIIEIEDESGKKTVFGLEQEILIRRKNFVGGMDEIKILGKDFQPEDEFVSYT